MREDKTKSELSTPPIGEREACHSEIEACLSTEIKSEDLKEERRSPISERESDEMKEEKEPMKEGEQQYLSKLETSANISCSEKEP